MVDVAQKGTVLENLGVSIAVDQGATVGIRSTGLVCIPTSRLVLEDFVPDQEAFKERVAKELSLMNSADAVHTTIKSIRLVKIEAKLCAKRYGVFGTGDKRSLSGKAVFTFDYVGTRNASVTSGLLHIDVEARPKDAMLEREFTVAAIRQLRMRFSSDLNR